MSTRSIEASASLEARGVSRSAQMTSTFFKPSFFGFVCRAPQKIFLHVYRVHMPASAEAFGDQKRIGTAPRTEIGDLHTALYIKGSDISFRMYKTYRV